ncbi:hypothetical protein WOLCODRAFT_84239 [Wolfiporia cocos MD-104 SS10]|uniref:DNA endonuclease activator Ctp1 C-terminal domain-containing protein n=1 Tax=Wolfiporia cocos (strain MD-104) TaxID=742152 RepID=A0A2H3J765_WOLCO|nr:hypothetical protein WOLCODRAFT_84239 [Wolfiporia cocos MD-104 SS10]
MHGVRIAERRRRAGGSAGKTVNELYAIDPARNEGRDYQFSDVVRNKAQRRHLDAEDCECCRDYYEAVGPLPPRLQPPLWRSPEGTPTKLAHKHKHLPARAPDFDAEQQQQQQQREIASHRQQISRHRQQWERSKTPPGYWEIGFPNTQEAAEINERARKMHEEKLAKIEQEAGCVFCFLRA